MELLLITDVQHVGRKGDVVRVRDGFGRNYLIPRKDILEIAGQIISPERKKQIESAVDRTIAEYGEVLRKLGKE